MSGPTEHPPPARCQTRPRRLRRGCARMAASTPTPWVGVFGADGEPLTDAHGKAMLLRVSDLTPPPSTAPLSDPAGTVRRVKRSSFGGVTGVVEASPDAPRHYRLGDDGKVYCIE